MGSVNIFQLTVNGIRQNVSSEPDTPLLDVLRHDLGLAGPRFGCGVGLCGACFVIIDGQARSSCDFPAWAAEGKDVTTVEGLAMKGAGEAGGGLHPLQEGFKQEHGLQCGFCTPGMMLAAKALLDRNPDPTEEEVRWALSGNLCRCTGYQNIVKSVLWAAEKLRGES
jgi:carbon-monoxide dehydrogenase small subunit